MFDPNSTTTRNHGWCKKWKAMLTETIFQAPETRNKHACVCSLFHIHPFESFILVYFSTCLFTFCPFLLWTHNPKFILTVIINGIKSFSFLVRCAGIDICPIKIIISFVTSCYHAVGWFSFEAVQLFLKYVL